MTRHFHVPAFLLLLVWGVFLIPTRCLAAPPDTELRDSDQATEQGDSKFHRPPNPLDRKLIRRDTSANSTAAKPTTKPSRSGVSVVQTALGLSFVLCLIFVVAAWAKRHLPQANRALPSEAVQILGQRPLGQRQMIQLIRCGSRILIVGSTPQGLTTLSEVTDPVEVDYLAGLCRQDQPNSVTSAFSRLFQNYRELSEEKSAPPQERRFPASSMRRSAADADNTDAPQQFPPHDTSISPERSLKERLGRLGQAGDASRFSPPGAEGSYE